MKTISRVLCALSLVLFSACDKDDSDSKGGDPQDVTYSVTYAVSEISDDYFACGSFEVSYADEKGETKVVTLDSADDVPFSVTVSDLSEDSKIYFDLIYGKNASLSLEDRQYTFTEKAYYEIKSSDDSVDKPIDLVNQTNTWDDSKVDTALTAIVNRDIEVETTIKEKL